MSGNLGRGKQGRPRSIWIDGVTEKGFGEVGLQRLHGERTTGKPKYWEKTCPSATLSTTNPT
jgi:hypothetical protein